ncbi:hypothetical protein [Kordiimonas sp.]|uniref:hypothetical protein n=1 Tax=Kordiimonas sp. TaxID=1970157 RepID=UPI003A90F33B
MPVASNNKRKTEARLAGLKAIRRRFGDGETWPWEWAVMEFVRQWIAVDWNWSALAQNHQFGERQISVFRKAYSVARGTVSTGNFKRICDDLRALPEWRALEVDFTAPTYLVCWEYLAKNLGGERGDTAKKIDAWSAASKYLWFCFPRDVALYDANACQTLGAWRGKAIRVTARASAEEYLSAYANMYETKGHDHIINAEKALGMQVPYSVRIFDKYLWVMALSDGQFDDARDIWMRQKDIFMKSMDTGALFST